jgi:membrane-associated phospholipid phosphatase
MGHWRLRTARVVTEATAPLIVCALLIPFVAWKGDGRASHGLAWGLAVMLPVAVLPLLYLRYGARTGRWEDHHVRDRAKRGRPLLLALVMALIALAGTSCGKGPRALVALLLAMFLGLVAVGAITCFWKISVHTAVATGALAVLVALLGPLALAGAPLLLLVAWSRVALGDHSMSQVAAGAALGAAVTLVVFWPTHG